MPDPADDFMKTLEPIGETRVTTAQGIATIALNLAMQYHRINTVQDGTLYQQYKLEGKNLTPLHLDMVLETAIQLEIHLLGSSDRIAKLVVDAITTPALDEAETSGEADDPGKTEP